VRQRNTQAIELMKNREKANTRRFLHNDGLRWLN
jgi:hypothetical protein